MFCVCTGSVFLLLIAGTINAARVRVTFVELTLPKKEGSRNTLNIALASDIHLGTMVGKCMLGRITGKIKGLNPDLILFAGDVLDEDPEPVMRKNLGEALKSLCAPLGVFAVPGNHEYYGGIEKARKYLSDHGVTLLRDRVVALGNCVNLAGREDPTMRGFSGKRRLSPRELLAGADTAYPVIVMDHQPPRRAGTAMKGADLLLCGHTHDGQFWPVNHITDRLFNPGYGHLRYNGTQVYVSSGAGTWGPPVRIGTRPEVVHLRIRFE
jgi:predicted MPP superfamily phosphohydrolase